MNALCVLFMILTGTVQKVSRVLNYRGLRILLTSSVILNVQLIFNSHFAWMAFLRFLSIKRNGSRESVSGFV